MNDLSGFLWQTFLGAVRVLGATAPLYYPLTGVALFLPAVFSTFFSFFPTGDLTKNDGTDLERLAVGLALSLKFGCVYLLPVLGIIAAVSSLRGPQDIFGTALGSVIILCGLFSVPVRAIEGMTWWLSIRKLASGLSSKAIIGFMVVVALFVGLAGVFAGQVVFVLAAIVDLFLSSLWWFNTKHPLLNGLDGFMLRFGMVMLMLGSNLVLSAHLLGQVIMGITFAFGIYVANREQWVRSLQHATDSASISTQRM